MWTMPRDSASRARRPPLACPPGLRHNGPEPDPGLHALANQPRDFLTCSPDRPLTFRPRKPRLCPQRPRPPRQRARPRKRDPGAARRSLRPGLRLLRRSRAAARRRRMSIRASPCRNCADSERRRKRSSLGATKRAASSRFGSIRLLKRARARRPPTTCARWPLQATPRPASSASWRRRKRCSTGTAATGSAQLAGMPRT